MQNALVKELRAEKAKGNSVDVVFYYAGHGFTSLEGSRYLSASDTKLYKCFCCPVVAKNLFSVAALQTEINQYARFKFVFLDACANQLDVHDRDIPHQGTVTDKTRTTKWHNTYMLAAALGTKLTAPSADTISKNNLRQCHTSSCSFMTQAFCELVRENPQRPIREFGETGHMKFSAGDRVSVNVPSWERAFEGIVNERMDAGYKIEFNGKVHEHDFAPEDLGTTQLQDRVNAIGLKYYFSNVAIADESGWCSTRCLAKIAIGFLRCMDELQEESISKFICTTILTGLTDESHVEPEFQNWCLARTD